MHISNTSLSLSYAFPSYISLLSSQRCCASGRRLPLKTTSQLKRQNEIKIVVKETLNHPPCQRVPRPHLPLGNVHTPHSPFSAHFFTKYILYLWWISLPGTASREWCSQKWWPHTMRLPPPPRTLWCLFVLESSVPDLLYGSVPTTGERIQNRIQILLFSSVAFKMPTKEKFFPVFFAYYMYTVGTYTSVFKNNNLLIVTKL